MPKKTFTINAFGGGFNTKKDFNDLDHESDKPECHSGSGVMLEEGGMSNNIPVSHDTTDVTSDALDSSANKFLVVPQDDGTVKAYTQTGVYAHGEDVNWSGNTDYKVFPPTEGMVNAVSNNGASYNYGIDLQVYPEREDDRLIILGSNAEQYPEVSHLGVTTRPGKICDQITLGDGTTVGARAADDFVQLNWGGAQGDPNQLGIGRNYWDDPNAGGQDIFSFIGTSVFNDGVDVVARGTSSYNGSFIDLSEGTSATNINSAYSSFDAFQFSRYAVDGTVGTDYESGGLVIRAGKVDSTANGTQNVGLYGFSSPTLDDYYLHLEYRIMEDNVGFLGFRILLDTDNNDMAINWDTNPISSYTKAWDFSLSELENGVDTDAYFGTVTKSWSESIHTGAEFHGGDVKMIWVVPMFTGLADAGSSGVVEIRELSFIKKPKSSNLWRDRKYAFYQSKVQNGVESLLTKYDVKIFGQTPGSNVNVGHYNTAYNSLNFSFIIPSASEQKQGKIYYRECNTNGDPYGEHFLLAEWDYRETNFKYKFSGGEWTTYNLNGLSTTPYNVHTPPKDSTFELETGYPEDSEDINAHWVASAVVGSQVYIGNIKGTYDADYQTSKILKTTNGRHAGFSDKDFIDLDLQGDEITVMESSGDRLFIFCKKDLYIVNVAQDIEFIEATLPGHGVDRYSQVTKVNEGLAFINGSGVYYFDGRTTKDITENKIRVEEYSFVPSSPGPPTGEPILTEGAFNVISRKIDGETCSIYYEPNENNLITLFDSETIFVYNILRDAWICKTDTDTQFSSNLISSGESNSMIMKSKVGSTDPEISTYYVPSGSTSIKYLDYAKEYYNSAGVTGANKATLFTGTISCGDINRRKKFYYLYLNCSDWNSTDPMAVYFSTDRGETWYQGTNADNALTNYLVSGENKINIKSSGKSIMFSLSSPDGIGTWPEYGKISDMSIVFRERTIK